MSSGTLAKNIRSYRRPTNIKLRARMIGIVAEICDVTPTRAEKMLEENDFSIRKVFEKEGKIVK